MRSSSGTTLLPHVVALGVGVFLLDVPAAGQSSDAPSNTANSDALSPECRVPASILYSLAPLQQVRSAVEQRHRLKVLALGPTSASTLAPGTGLAPFPIRLEHELEKVLPGVDVVVEARSLPGEITAQASPTIMNLVSEVEPELVVWQVGISDALAQADVSAFSSALAEVLAFFHAHSIDAVLVEPPFTAAMARDDHFTELVEAISARASANGVVLIRRSAAMRYVAEQRAAAGRSRFELQIAVTIAPLSISAWWYGSRWSASRGPNRGDVVPIRFLILSFANHWHDPQPRCEAPSCQLSPPAAPPSR